MAVRARSWKSLAVFAVLGVCLDVAAQTNDNDALAKCREIVDATERLRCYDALAARKLPPPSIAPPPTPALLDRDDPRSALVPAGKRAEDRSLLSQRWELEPEDKYGAFKFTHYRPNYFLPVHVSDRINQRPGSPTRSTTEAINYNRPEAAFQLSFKMKLVEQAFGTPSDVWLGYTQLSLWQIYNADLSREFRNGDSNPR